MDIDRTLTISPRVLRGIHACAREADSKECMGLLARRIDDESPRVTAACLLPAEASGSHAEADPVDIKRAAMVLRQRGLRPSGLWHSHGSHRVFHSPTDDQTLERFVAGMAGWNVCRPRPPWVVPVLTGANRAVLPLPDGQALHFLLRGPAVPGTDAHEPAAWDSIAARFRPTPEAPWAIQDARRLHLAAGNVRLSLGIPEGATVLSHKEDVSSLRTSTLYSLVVNKRGDEHAEALVVHEIDGCSILRKGPCAIELAEEGRGAEGPRLISVADVPVRAAPVLPGLGVPGGGR